MIEVRRVAEGDPMDFEVVIREGEGETRHHVTMSRQMCDRLAAGKHTPERCLEAAFRFVLDREPKESILRRFESRATSPWLAWGAAVPGLNQGTTDRPSISGDISAQARLCGGAVDRRQIHGRER